MQIILFGLFCVQYSLVFGENDVLRLKDHREFFNFGIKKPKASVTDDNGAFKSKVEVLGRIFKEKITEIKSNNQLDFIFLIDASSSIGEINFKNELKFVRKLLSDVTIDYDHSRIALITYSSRNKIVKSVDEISKPKMENNKCLLLNKEIDNITYSGGDTFTLGAFETAKEIFQHSRNSSKKVLFLITDGFSNGGDPVPVAQDLKKDNVTIFTIGIRNGNFQELYQLSSSPGEYYSYLLDSYNQFESLARRALHVDLQTGEYIPLGTSKPCDNLCKEGNCCDEEALCTCGTSTGHYSCICKPGFFGSGLHNDCSPCPINTFSNGPNLCLPCPDPNQSANLGSIGIESCKCKSGFQPTNDNRCEVLKCEKLAAPEHGYFVKKRECANVLNSACGIRCEIGYILEGTSIRLCQANATWSGQEPSCLVKTCEALQTPLHGNMTCKHQELETTYTNEPKLPVDTVCSFSCDQGRTLLGSKQRTCLPLAHWDGLKTSCKLVKCNKLPKIPFGKIEPSSCQIGKQNFGKHCSISCEDGFELIGPKEKICNGFHGNWNNKKDNKCKDVTKPVLICPENIKNFTLPGKNYGNAHWKLLNVTDNSGLNVTIWTKPSISNVTNFKFKLGTTIVTYYAQDFQRNVAKCSFNVEIIDNEKPTIELCSDPPPYLTFDKSGANITWDEPNIFDNSRNVRVEKSHDFGFFKVGTTSVIYKAIDLSNNTNTCVLNITVEVAVCDPLPNPLFGQSSCTTGDNKMQCVITCQEGYALPIPLQSESIDYGDVQYVCNEDNPPWMENKIFPECTITEIPLELIDNVTIHIESKEIEAICSDNKKLSELNKNVAVDLEKSLKEACNDIDCFVKTESECEEVSEKIKRQTQETQKRKKPKRIKVKLRLNAKNKPNKRKKLKRIRDDLKNIESLNGNPVIAIRFEAGTIICPDGCVVRKQKCVRCPLGTFHNKTSQSCQSCDLGSYNDKEAQTQCFSCPENKSTKKLHSKSITACIEKCPPGKIGRKRTIRPRNYPNITITRVTLPPYCKSCPLGTYQSNYGQHECLKCPLGYTTNSVGSKSIYDCVPSVDLICTNLTICNQGKCIVQDNFYYSCECNHLFIGSHCETKINTCSYSPCLHGGICKLKSDGLEYFCSCPEGFSGQNCEIPEEKCTLKCENGGTCLHDDQDEICVCKDRFTGKLCNQKISDYCTNSFKICENNSTCINEGNSVRCICQPGFIGRRCSYLPCDFQPCPKQSICENIYASNATRKSYVCQCYDGFTGINCTERVDPCFRNKCKNNGKCRVIGKSYICECQNDFYGEFCDFEAKERYILSFNRAGVTDSVRLGGFKDSLNEISVCSWIHTLDNFNYGTVLSYATREHDNAFTITDYAGLVFYINNKTIISDIKLNDGFWHYFCFTWSGLTGTYQVYVDGKIAQKGNEFAKGEYLGGNGTMMIGQEQDIMGGRFSQSEAFLGKLSEFDMWSRILDIKEIKSIMNSCNGQPFGDVISWPILKDFVFGHVQIESSPFCQQCKPPNPLYNGHIEIKNNTAFYICNKGYTLNEELYLNGRKCNKATEWEDRIEPFCRTVYCGYPGYLRHGRILGRRYSYQSEIKHICNPTYSLIGSSIRKCTDNGTWSPEPPKCEGKRCKAFKTPNNSKITIFSDYSDEYIEGVDSFDMGTSIEILCENGSKLIGENYLTCNENGQWDNEIPECVSTKPKLPCPLDHIPAPPENGFIVEKSKEEAFNGTGNVIQYKCNDGFLMEGVSTSTCIIDGYWSQPNVTCKTKKCPNPPKIKNSKIMKAFEKSFYVVGDNITFECLPGYKLLGNSIVRCIDPGKWTRIKPKCIKISCGKPDVAESTEILGESYLFDDTITLLCGDNKNYKLTCGSSGSWIGDINNSC
nr:sushi, von Willebrand factor type A, EGF and pentraxin domain-containing protein 1-like isoform X2 [Onthophagus taurus]